MSESDAVIRPAGRVPCQDCGRPTVTYAVLNRHRGTYALCGECSLRDIEEFASYCPHCHTGDPGEDYCGSCGEAL